MLEVRGLSVAYGATVAVNGVDLDVADNEIVAVMGANGAGKSSLMKAIAGLQPHTGAVLLNGENLSGVSAPDRVRRRMVHVLEQRGIFAELTVQENLDLGAYLRSGRESRSVLREELDKVFALFPRLRERRHNQSGSLSGGEQQMLVIGRALMAAPTMLILDEPSLGLAPVVVDEIARALRRLNAEHGMALLISEQNTALGLSLASRGYVIQRGRIALAGSSEELRSRDDVIQFYLGAGTTPARADEASST